MILCFAVFPFCRKVTRNIPFKPSPTRFFQILTEQNTGAEVVLRDECRSYIRPLRIEHRCAIGYFKEKILFSRGYLQDE